MKKLLKYVSLITFFIITSAPSFAQVTINEFSSSGSDDWVELYNVGDSSVDLSQYRIRDSSKTNKKDLSGSLEQKKFVSFPLGNDLNNKGDTIKLLKVENGSETEVESIGYGSKSSLCMPEGEQTGGRKPDGTGGFVRFKTATKDAANTSEELPCDKDSSTSRSKEPQLH